MLVIHRHPGMSAEVGKFRLWRDQRVERHHQLVHPPIQIVVVEPPPGRDADPEILADTLKHRFQVARCDPLADRALLVDPATQDRGMG